MADEFAIIAIEFETELGDLPKIRKALTGTLSKDGNPGLFNYRCRITLDFGISNPDAAIHVP